jgi:hypothetical protein
MKPPRLTITSSGILDPEKVAQLAVPLLLKFIDDKAKRDKVRVLSQELERSSGRIDRRSATGTSATCEVTRLSDHRGIC